METFEASSTEEILESMLKRECIGCTPAQIAVSNLVELLNTGAVVEINAQTEFDDVFSKCDGQITGDGCSFLQERPKCGHPDGGCKISHLWQS